MANDKGIRHTSEMITQEDPLPCVSSRAGDPLQQGGLDPPGVPPFTDGLAIAVDLEHSAELFKHTRGSRLALQRIHRLPQPIEVGMGVNAGRVEAGMA